MFSQTEKVSIYQADLTATYLMSRVYLYMQDYKMHAHTPNKSWLE